MKDKILTCIQCGESFLFTVSEQEQFMDRHFDMPKRCSICRKKKYKVIDSQETGKHSIKKRNSRYR